MHIAILQWNIWYKENIENVVAFIKEINPVIVCLQELSVNGTYNRESTRQNMYEML